MAKCIALALLALLTLGCQKDKEAKILDRLDEINARLMTLEGRMTRIETLAETVTVDSAALPIHLPRTSVADAPEAPTVHVMLSETGLVVDGKQVDADELEATFSAISDKTPGASVVLSADATVPHRRVVDAMDAIKQAGLNKIAIAVEKAGSPDL